MGANLEARTESSTRRRSSRRRWWSQNSKWRSICQRSTEESTLLTKKNSWFPLNVTNQESQTPSIHTVKVRASPHTWLKRNQPPRVDNSKDVKFGKTQSKAIIRSREPLRKNKRMPCDSRIMQVAQILAPASSLDDSTCLPETEAQYRNQLIQSTHTWRDEQTRSSLVYLPTKQVFVHTQHLVAVQIIRLLTQQSDLEASITNFKPRPIDQEQPFCRAAQWASPSVDCTTNPWCPQWSHRIISRGLDRQWVNLSPSSPSNRDSPQYRQWRVVVVDLKP